MSFHGQFHTDEPPGGDYVRYIESLVGQPPEDVERAATELARRLGTGLPPTWPARLAPSGGLAQAPAGTAPGIALGTTRAPITTIRPVPGLRQAFSRVLVVIGALLLGLGLIAPEAISMAPGIFLLFAGLAIGRKARRRAARTPSGTT